jgi:hypothetical protein
LKVCVVGFAIKDFFLPSQLIYISESNAFLIGVLK